MQWNKSLNLLKQSMLIKNSISVMIYYSGMIWLKLVRLNSSGFAYYVMESSIIKQYIRIFRSWTVDAYLNM